MSKAPKDKPKSRNCSGKTYSEHLVINSDMKLLELVRNFVLGIVRQSSLSSDCENKVVLAIDEAVTNIIEHAYARKTHGYINIEANTDKEKISFVITDSGRCFNPELIKKPDIIEHIKKGSKRGLGIFLMRQIMDEVKYTFKSGQNQLNLVKYIK